MKHLILVRHAKSSWDDPHAQDHERKLSKRGKQDMPVMAARLHDTLAHFKLNLQAVFTSPAVRARDYAKVIGEQCNCRVTKKEALYTFSATTLLNELLALPDELDCVAVVGHNPAMTSAANSLSTANLHNMPTAAFLVLECKIQSWQALLTAPHEYPPAEHKVLEFNFPKKDND